MQITDVAVNPREVTEKTRGYFQTPIRDSKLVLWLIEEYSRIPRFFAQMTDPELESSHFTSWFNVLTLRQYTNPWIGDLYLVHELAHMVHMNYVPDTSWNYWCNKVKQNETLASIFSEILIYFEIPNLRQNTFEHAIWVDKILQDPTYHQIYWQDRDYFIQLMYQARMNTMMNPQDFVDRQIANYNSQNSLWCDIWRDHYNVVECHMHVWPTFGHNINSHIKWLEDQSQTKGQIIIPFEDCARKFSQAYQQIKIQFGNQNLK